MWRAWRGETEVEALDTTCVNRWIIQSPRHDKNRSTLTIIIPNRQWAEVMVRVRVAQEHTGIDMISPLLCERFHANRVSVSLSRLTQHGRLPRAQSLCLVADTFRMRSCSVLRDIARRMTVNKRDGIKLFSWQISC